MGCGASAQRKTKGPEAQAPVTTQPLVVPSDGTDATTKPDKDTQCARAIFAVLLDEELPKHALSQKNRNVHVAWQKGNPSCEKWEDLSDELMLQLEGSYAPFHAGFGTPHAELEDGDTKVNVDFALMSIQRLGEEYTNIVELERQTSLADVDVDKLIPVRRLENEHAEQDLHLDDDDDKSVEETVWTGGSAPSRIKWVVSYPDPDSMHPLRQKRIAAKDGDDWMNNDFFWQGFKGVLQAKGHKVEASTCDEMFDFAHNQDFRNFKGRISPMQRGGVPYSLPIGWKRFAVRVAGQFDNGDNTWMCLDGRKGEWAVAYHGTKQDALLPILLNGLKAGSRQAYSDEVGSGIYCTPNLSVAIGYSSVEQVGSHKVRFVLQCRVRPAAIKKCSKANYWVINKTEDMRPYGILVQQC